MDSYIDIAVRSGVDLSPSELLSALFGEIHLALAARRSTSTGISFPHADRGLGDVLRLHGDTAALVELVGNPWLKRASDYYRFSEPAVVPPSHGWCSIRRKQPKLTMAKARRLVARGSLDVEEAKKLTRGAERLDEPFVQIRSRSTGQRFRLFIEQRPCDPPSSPPSFNAYGLGGAVPWF